MNGSLSDDFECEECGGAMRCVGGGFRHDLDGNVLGIVEGFECVENDDHSGEVISKDGEIYRLTGVVER
jgi:hypothetical protein